MQPPLRPPVRLYNTATRRLDVVDIPSDRPVGIYTCGPTVYRPVHLGNLRSYILADSLKRLLVAFGIPVRHVKNITDVGHMRQELLDRGEDKLIAEAVRSGMTASDIAKGYTQTFFEDEQQLNILPADVFPRATDHVERMIAITAELVQSGHAYERDGNVYFRVDAFGGYGELGGSLSREGLRQGVRADVDPLKGDPRDFALWKHAEDGRTDLVWSSPWGLGFPGWHIECTAMSTQHLGAQVDIHTGGVDNIFPHHEDERAQSEAFTGVKPFAKTWVHGQHLLADGLKMAKSTGNAYALDDIGVLGFEPLAFRYLCLTSHYRARLNFTLSSLRAAQRGLYRLRRLTSRLSGSADGQERGAARLSDAAEDCRTAFWTAAASDLGLPRCLAVVWALMRGPHASISHGERLALIQDFERLLGLGLLEAPQRRRPDPFAGAVSSPRSVPDQRDAPDAYRLSVCVVVQPDEDVGSVERCVESVVAHADGVSLEVVVVDATGSVSSHERLMTVAERAPDVVVLWIDHDPGAAAARNAAFRSARGTYVALLDPSIEVRGPVWRQMLDMIEHDRSVGGVGTFGLVTADMRHFHEAAEEVGYGRAVSREVDALQNYLLLMRRSDLARVTPLDEHYRFYRILDLDLSYALRANVGRLVSLDGLPVVRHRHALWEALSEGDRAERSRKNFGRFLKRWDHRHDLARHGDAAALATSEAAVHG